VAEIDVAQAKWPSGQAFFPCKPQGRQAKFSVVSMQCALSESGPKPNAGTVLQYTAQTEALTEEAKCIGAESFT
jgi:hypothetical protein